MLNIISVEWKVCAGERGSRKNCWKDEKSVEEELWAVNIITTQSPYRSLKQKLPYEWNFVEKLFSYIIKILFMQQKLNLKQIFLASPDLARSRKGKKDLLSDQGRYKNWERGG